MPRTFVSSTLLHNVIIPQHWTKMSQSLAIGVDLHRDVNGMLPSNSCSKLWGIKQQCLLTRHYCMFKDAASVIKIGDKHVCGVSFCSACVENASSAGSNLCPYHNPNFTLYWINPWITFVENGNQVKLLHIKEGIIATREKCFSCKMKSNSQCCFTTTTKSTIKPWTVYRFC